MTLFDLFHKTAIKFPLKTALITQSGLFSYGDLLRILAVMEANLLKSITGSGKKIAFYSNQQHLLLAMVFFASRHGHTLYLLRPGQINKTGVDFDFVVTDMNLPQNNAAEPVKITQDWFANVKTAQIADVAAPDQQAMYGFGTSGSTGDSKIFPLQEHILVGECLEYGKVGFHGSRVEAIRLYVALRPEMRWAMQEFMVTFHQGGSACSLNDKQEVLPSFIDKFHVTSMTMSPALAEQLLNLEGASQFFTSIDNVLVGGALVTSELMQSIHEQWGAEVFTAYGASEIGLVTKKVFDPDVPFAPGYLGELDMGDGEIVFFDEDLNILPDADQGILGVRKPIYEGSSYYEGLTDAENGKHYVDGFFITGDIIRREGDSLYMTGRAKNIINHGGNKQSLEQIEAAFKQAFDIASVVALVDRSETGIELLRLCYVGPEDLEFEMVRDTMKRLIPKIPIESLHKTDIFPLGDSGKVQRARLLTQILNS